MPKDIHVLPENDLKPHDETRACWCQPSVRREGKGMIVVHNSLDGRELVERHGVN